MRVWQVAPSAGTKRLATVFRETLFDAQIPTHHHFALSLSLSFFLSLSLCRAHHKNLPPPDPKLEHKTASHAHTTRAMQVRTERKRTDFFLFVGVCFGAQLVRRVRRRPWPEASLQFSGVSANRGERVRPFGGGGVDVWRAEEPEMKKKTKGVKEKKEAALQKNERSNSERSEMLGDRKKDGKNERKERNGKDGWEVEEEPFSFAEVSYLPHGTVCGSGWPMPFAVDRRAETERPTDSTAEHRRAH